jgi:hypothetical protein
MTSSSNSHIHSRWVGRGVWSVGMTWVRSYSIPEFVRLENSSKKTCRKTARSAWVKTHTWGWMEEDSISCTIWAAPRATELDSKTSDNRYKSAGGMSWFRRSKSRCWVERTCWRPWSKAAWVTSWMATGSTSVATTRTCVWLNHVARDRLGKPGPHPNSQKVKGVHVSVGTSWGARCCKAVAAIRAAGQTCVAKKL